MLRRQLQIRSQLRKLVDAGLYALAFWLAHWVRAYSGIDEILGLSEGVKGFEDYIFCWIYIIFLTPFVLETQGVYSIRWLSPIRQMVIPLARSSIIATLGLILILFLIRDTNVARGAVILCGVFSFGFELLKEQLMRVLIISRYGPGESKKRVFLIGTKEDVRKLREEFTGQPYADLEVLVELDLNSTSVDELIQLLHDKSPNGVILSSKHTFFGKIELAIQACELEGVEVWLMADFFKTQISQTTVDDFYGRPMLVFRSAPDVSWQGLAKQVIDLFGGLVLLIVLTPTLLIPIMIGIRITSPGPIFFRQTRSGLSGRPFTMLKFRSMVSDAEQLKHELEALNEMEGPVFKISNDPRITPIGRLLRKYSIDEFPQLINVLRGEMSLVGPRPLPVDEVKRFDDFSHRRRLSVKPGLTCLWQISGRNNVKDFTEWVRLDLEYIDNWSFWLDIKILIKTIPVVVFGHGAK